MGMDVHGKNPKQNKPLSEFPVYYKFKDMKFEDKWKELDADHDLREQYWKEQTDYEEVNSGNYFRNNCWWWRPLWNYCHIIADDLIDGKLHDSGHSNSGAGLDDKGAKLLGNRLLQKIREGHTIEYKTEYDKCLDALPDDDCWSCKNNNRGHSKKKECVPCNKTGKQTNFNKHYPFGVDNVKAFAEFCIQSGGFEIC